MLPLAPVTTRRHPVKLQGAGFGFDRGCQPLPGYRTPLFDFGHRGFRRLRVKAASELSPLDRIGNFIAADVAGTGDSQVVAGRAIPQGQQRIRPEITPFRTLRRAGTGVLYLRRAFEAVALSSSPFAPPKPRLLRSRQSYALVQNQVVKRDGLFRRDQRHRLDGITVPCRQPVRDQPKVASPGRR